MSLLRICLIVISFSLVVGACAPQKSTKMMSEKEEQMIAAKADCFEQAQSMSNESLDRSDASGNPYYSMCMQSKYGYTLEQIRAMDY